MVCDASVAGPSGVGARHSRRHYAAHYVRDGHGLRAGLPIRSGVKSIATTEYRHALPAGSERPPKEVTARKPQYYGRFNEPVLWRDVMCAKTSRKLRFSEHAKGEN
jgi:hypothetical protein